MKQEELNEKLKSVIRQAREIGIPVPDNISENVVINPRPRKRFGCCRRQADKFQIEVSSFVLDCLSDKIAGVLAHEILHTCADCNNHGKIWKKHAAAMNEAYGYNIKRTSTFEEMGLSNMARGSETNCRTPAVRYIIKCRKCGKEYPRQRRSKAVENVGRYRCVCGGRLMILCPAKKSRVDTDRYGKG